MSAYIPIPSESLAFKRFEIYATCAISIYFYDSIIHVNEVWAWYSKKQWIISDFVCFILDKINTLAYCMVILLFLYFVEQTSMTCGSLSLLSLSYYALGIIFQCLLLLSILRKFYKSSIILVILFLFAGTTSILHVANIFGFGNFVQGNDGNCYLQRGQSPEQFVPAGFVMMAIFCWMIFGLIAIRIHMMWGSLNEKKQIRQKWREILFVDGLFYLGLIALFQTINVIFILASQGFFERFINVTPTLILTSICAKHLIFAKTKKKNNNSMTAPLNVKVQDNDSFIINDILPIPRDRSRSISLTNSTNSFAGVPISPTNSTNSINSINSTNSFAGIPIAPPTPIMISDFGPSLTTYFNNYTTTSLNNSRPSSKQHSLPLSKHSSKYSGKHISNVNNNSRLQVVQSTSQTGSYSSRESKRSTHTILQSIFRSNSNRSNNSNNSNNSNDSNNNLIPHENQRRSNLRRSQGKVMESDDFYCFRYSEFDNDVFLFPAIPPQNPSKSNVKGKLTSVNKPLPPKPGFF